MTITEEPIKLPFSSSHRINQPYQRYFISTSKVSETTVFKPELGRPLFGLRFSFLYTRRTLPIEDVTATTRFHTFRVSLGRRIVTAPSCSM